MPTYTSSTPLVFEVDDASVEVLDGGPPTNVGFPPTATIGADQGRGGILLYARRA